MQLRVARVCLDCEEIHDALQCPVCASQSFAYLTRWLPAPERRILSRPAVRPNPPKLSGPRLVVGCGILGRQRSHLHDGRNVRGNGWRRQRIGIMES